MGQKVNPIAFRIPLASGEAWKSKWFTTSHKRYIQYLNEDMKLRTALMKKLASASITQVVIERSLKSMKITVYVTRPGVVIGRGGCGD